MAAKPPSRRRFLKSGAALAGLTLTGARPVLGQTTMAEAMAPKNKELIAYGERSKFVNSIRVPVSGRMSPDMYGLTFHVLTPLQDQFGIITPSSLFYVATHRGSYVPEINPAEHRLMIHGLVDRPIIFDGRTEAPSVNRIH